MGDEENRLSRSQQERLNYIEQRLLWERRYKSNMLVEQFGISKALAHKDIALYKKLFPNNIAPFNPKEGFLRPSTAFTSRLADPSRPPTQLITQIPRLKKTVDSKTIELILKAIELNRSIEINYASSSTPLGKKRLITPYRVINASNRLHFRGYCHLKGNYRDFVIARCLTLPKLKETPCDIPEDIEFNTSINLKLKVNNALCEDGQRLIEKEYSEVLARENQLPRALFHYFLIDNNLPTTQEQIDLAQRSPWTYPLLAEIESEKGNLFGNIQKTINNQNV
jgi:predicted DNA-binding transcriptional regulator YafY